MTWEARLKPGERLLWQGQPDARVLPGRGVGLTPTMRVVVSVVVLGVSGLFILAVAPKLAGHPVMMIVAALFVLFLLWWLWFLLSGMPRVDAFLRSRTRYALTDRRALTAIRWPGWTWVSSHRIREGEPVFWNGRSPGDVIYHQFTVVEGMMRRKYRLGFFMIRDGDKVKALIEAVQANLAREAV